MKALSPEYLNNFSGEGIDVQKDEFLVGFILGQVTQQHIQDTHECYSKIMGLVKDQMLKLVKKLHILQKGLENDFSTKLKMMDIFQVELGQMIEDIYEMKVESDSESDNSEMRDKISSLSKLQAYQRGMSVYSLINQEQVNEADVRG